MFFVSQNFCLVMHSRVTLSKYQKKCLHEDQVSYHCWSRVAHLVFYKEVLVTDLIERTVHNEHCYVISRIKTGKNGRLAVAQNPKTYS